VCNNCTTACGFFFLFHTYTYLILLGWNSLTQFCIYVYHLYTWSHTFRASPPVLSMSLWIIKLNVLSLASFFLATLPIRLTRTAFTSELLMAIHLDQSLWSTNKNYWAVVRSNLLHSFLEEHSCVAPFTIHCKLHKFGAGKPISWAKPAHFDFFTIIFLSGVTYWALVEMLLHVKCMYFLYTLAVTEVIYQKSHASTTLIYTNLVRGQKWWKLF